MSLAPPGPAPLTVSADELTECDREAIHLAGSVQSVGFLLVVTADWLIARASANAPDFLGLPLDQLLGARLDRVLSDDAVHTIRNRLSMVLGETSVERAFSVALQESGPRFDLALHFVGASIVLEAEPSEPAGNLNAGMIVRSMIERLHLPQTIAHFTREAARQIRALTGFDRVMVYRFHTDGTGEVVAESLRVNVDSFLGLRFPATDIPVQARALYVKNLLRLIADVDAADAIIEPLPGPGSVPLDLTMSVLRAVSPVHLQYLRNMGVKASMSISILRDGKLWGLIACHHLEPRQVSFERRTTAELFVQMFSMQLERRERDEAVAYVERARALHSQMLGAMANHASDADNIAGLAARMGELVAHDGIGIWAEGKAILRGSTPPAAEFASIVAQLNREEANRVYSTTEIGKLSGNAATFVDEAAGLLAIPISRTPRDYLVFFRREVARSLTWAGQQTKAHAADGRLSPRNSFDAWREIVRGQSLPWTPSEIAAAEEMRVALLEIVLRHAHTTVLERHDETLRQELLIAELNHRVRNILGLVNGLVSQSGTSAENIDGFRAVLGARVQSLARAHDQITADNWRPASLRRLIAVETEAYLGVRDDCVRVEGPSLLLAPRAFTTMALLLHELTTNSAKYGAIGSAHGVATIAWSLDAAGQCVLTWSDAGGPPVMPPSRRGFGSTIIERSVPHDLGGAAAIDYLPAGVEARFVIPAEFLTIGEEPVAAVSAVRTDFAVAARFSGPVLLVEDSMIIALDAEALLLKLGASRVDIASNIADAMRLIDIVRPALAVLDVNIGDSNSFAVAVRLLALGVPVIFATGYGVAFACPPVCRDVPVVTKPYTIAAVSRAIEALTLA